MMRTAALFHAQHVLQQRFSLVGTSIAAWPPDPDAKAYYVRGGHRVDRLGSGRALPLADLQPLYQTFCTSYYRR